MPTSAPTSVGLEAAADQRPTSPSAAFYRCGAAAAAASVVGIVMAQLILRPPAAAPGVSGMISAYADPTFQAQSLVILLQVMAMFVALLAVGARVFRAAPGLTLLALAALLLWQVFELIPRSIEFFVFSLHYASDYVAGAADATVIESEFRRFQAWERGWRTMRQAVWAASLLLIGAAAWRGTGIARLAAALLIVNGLRVATLFGASLLGAALPFGRALFVTVNLACFGVIAAWLITPTESRR
jgi:hypothetical protein